MERLLTFIGEDDRALRIPEADADAWREQETAAGRKIRPAVSYVGDDGAPMAVEEADAPAFEEQSRAEGRRVERGFAVLAGNEPVIVRESKRQDFLKEYRTRPEFEADRTAARATVQAQADAAPDKTLGGKTWGETLRDVPGDFAQGYRTNARLMAGGDIVLGRRPVTDAGALLREEELEPQREEGGFWQDAVTGAARLAGQMGEMQPRAVITGSGVGLAAGLAGGGAMGAKGFKAGYGVSLALDSYRQGAGDIYLELARGGADPQKARAIAGALAVPYGVIGMLQLKGLLPKDKVVGQALRKRVLDVARTMLVRTGAQAAGEGGQETLKQGAVSAEQILRGAIPKEKWTEELARVVRSGVEEFKATVGPMAIMQIPGAAAGVTGNGKGKTPNAQRSTLNAQVPGTEMGPPEAPGVAGTALVSPPLPMTPPVAPGAAAVASGEPVALNGVEMTPEMQERVPLLDQGPLPAAPVGPMVGPTVKAAADLPAVAVQPLNAEVPRVEYRIPPGEIKRATYKDLKAFAQGNRYLDGETVWDRAVGRDKLSLQRALLVHRRAYMDAEGAQERAGPSDETRRKLSAAAKRRMVDRANTAESEYVAAQKIREVMGSEQQVIPEDELNNGDMVFNDGQWYKVAKRANGVTVLEDGVRIEYDRYSPVPLQGVVTAEHPAYDAASEEYQAQEQAEAQKGTPKQVIKGDAPAVTDGDAGFEFGAEESGPEDLTLDVLTPAELEADAARVEAERAAKAQRREVAVRAAAPIQGNAGDQTMVIPGMEGEVDADLFDAADQQARRALGMEEPAGRGSGPRNDPRTARWNQSVDFSKRINAQPSNAYYEPLRTAAKEVNLGVNDTVGDLVRQMMSQKGMTQADVKAWMKSIGIKYVVQGFPESVSRQALEWNDWAIDKAAEWQANNNVMVDLETGEQFNPGSINAQATERSTVSNERLALTGAPAAVPSPAQPGPGGAAADMEAAGAARGREGAITLPSGVPRGMRAGLRRIGVLFMPNRGVGDTTYDLFNEMNRKLSAANMAGREFRNRIRGVVNGLQDVHGRDNVMAALREVQEGDLTPAGFSGRFGLARGNDVERFLGVMLRDTEAASQRILKWSGRSKEARANVAEQTFYQTRAYLVHALGEGYDPPESARRAASLEFKAGLADAVQRLAVGASAVRGRRGGLDVVSWLETGDEVFLRHASRTRADAARTLRGQYLVLRGMIDELAVRGDHVTARLNAEAATRAADGFVEFYLKRSADRGTGGGGNAAGSVETGHLRARFLEGALRNLYGEITDPAVRQQITTEVQSRMLAEMTFFERVFAECEGVVWAYQPDLAKGIVERLGDAKNQADRMKYGDMAGRYVTAEFRGLIDAARNKGAVHETMKAIYFGPMGFQRMAKLLAPKTISRNYITGLMGFGLQSGDVFLPGYWRDFGEGHRLAVDYARGRPDAIARIRELTELGVFAAGGTSATADMQAALGGAGARMAKLGKGVTEAYAFIDFPTKYAAFQARQRAGMSRAQAVQHVQDLYQNRERTPAIVGKVSRIGLADYLSYPYDSTRIAVNGLRHAVAEAKAGRVLPLFGWITARSIFALTSVKATQMASEAAGKLYAEIAKLIRPDDDDEKKGEKPGIAPLESAQLAQMRKLVMPYDANAPLLSWRETQGGRLKYVGYTVAGGQTAFPIDDWIVGLLQSPEHGEGFLNAVGGSIANLIDEGMYVDTWARAIGGSGFDGKRTPTGKGLWHVMPGKEEPERAQIIGDAIKGWIGDMVPTYPAQMWLKLVKRERDLDAGIENVGIFARRQRSAAEIVVAGHRLVRSYTMNRTEMNATVRNAIRPQLEGLERTREIVSGAERQRIEQGAVRPRNEAAAESAQEKRAGYVREVADTLKAAQAVAPEWWDVISINLVLKESGMPEQEIYQVLNTVADAPTDTRYFPSPNVSPYRTRIYQDLTR